VNIRLLPPPISESHGLPLKAHPLGLELPPSENEGTESTEIEKNVETSEYDAEYDAENEEDAKNLVNTAGQGEEPTLMKAEQSMETDSCFTSPSG
jgi:hypothetical protein